MKLLLHIGAAKAGSTTIQDSLFLNRAALAQQGIAYWQPSDATVPPPRVLSNLFEPGRKPLLPKERLHFATREESRAFSRREWDRMAAEIGAQGPALTILSSESLYYLRPGPILDELRRTFSEIVVLMYVRDPVPLYRSALDQLIRDGARLADLPLPAQVRLGAADTLRRYRQQLGAENVILRRFDRACLAGGDLLVDLYQQIGLIHGQPVAPLHPVHSTNESFSAAATLWILGLNEGFERLGSGGDAAQIQRRQVLLERLRRAPGLTGLPKLTDPPAAIQDWIRRANRDDIAFLNQHAFDRTLPLEGPDSDAPLPPEAEQRQAVRDWLLGQVKPEDLARVLVAALP